MSQTVDVTQMIYNVLGEVFTLIQPLLPYLILFIVLILLIKII